MRTRSCNRPPRSVSTWSSDWGPTFIRPVDAASSRLSQSGTSTPCERNASMTSRASRVGSKIRVPLITAPHSSKFIADTRILSALYKAWKYTEALDGPPRCGTRCPREDRRLPAEGGLRQLALGRRPPARSTRGPCQQCRRQHQTQRGGGGHRQHGGSRSRTAAPAPHSLSPNDRARRCPRCSGRGDGRRVAALQPRPATDLLDRWVRPDPSSQQSTAPRALGFLTNRTGQ